MLIARYLPIMKVYRLKGRDNLGFSGNVVNVTQSIEELVSILPRSISQLPVLIVRRRTSTEVVSYRDFHVNRVNIYRWLYFLKRWNPAYADIQIQENAIINTNILNEVTILNNVQRNTNSRESTTDDDECMDEMGEDDDAEAGPFPSDAPQEYEDDYLETGATSLEAREQGLLEAQLIENAVINWPAQGDTPVDEYNLAYLLTCSWPTLFPFGRGDVSNRSMRIVPITWNQAIKHYQNYARFDASTDSWHYPFASNHRFMFYVHDVDERHRAQSSCAIYMSKNTIDSNMTIQDLRAILRQRSSEDFALQRRMQRYAANILGSPAYMAEEKNKLMSLMGTRLNNADSSNFPTIWWTLTLANYYWQDLHQLYGSAPTIRPNETEIEFQSRFRSHYRKKYSDYPHIVDEMFCHRVKDFVATFFGKDGLEATWLWYRYEFQKRGNIHAHGLARLKNAPDLQTLSRKVVKGRKAAQILRLAKDILLERHDNLTLTLFPSDDAIAKESDDHFIPLLEQEMKQKIETTMLTPEQIQKLIEDIQLGNNAAREICAYRDTIVNTWNPSPPADAVKETRDESSISLVFQQHPCFQCHSIPNGQHALRTEMYANLLEHCLRHRHHPGYCLKNGECRFHFPRPLSFQNKIIVKEIAYKTHRDGLKGRLRRTSVEFLFKTNDRWLNSHTPIGVLAWGANLDMSILVDSAAVIEYVAKYCTKTEPCSKGFYQILNSAFTKRQERGELETRKVLRTMFNLLSKRDKCTQEVAHLVASRPYVHCSHSFVRMNLMSDLREVAASGDESVPALEMNLLDLYAGRCTASHWKDRTMYIESIYHLQQMSLATFARKFTSTKVGSHRKIVPRGNAETTVVLFAPDYSSHEDSPHYWCYCYMSLVKYKPHESRESLYPGDTHTDFLRSNCRIEQADVSDDEKQSIISSWENFLESVDEDDFLNLPDAVYRQVQSIRRNPDDLSNNLMSFSNGFDIDEEDPEFSTSLYNQLINDCTQDMEWDETEDWRTPKQSYNENEFDIGFVSRAWTDNASSPSTVGATTASVTIDQCNDEQKNVVKVWAAICRQVHARNSNNSSNSEDQTAQNALIINGVAGTGKSHTIKAMVNATNNLPWNENKKVLILAPTGKAALGAGGFTLHSAMGLSLPVQRRGAVCKKLAGQKLIQLQERFRDISAIIIDEYSMMSLLDLYWTHQRLTQAKNNSKPFGGIPIAFIGDPGQLPPVGGQSLWVTRISPTRPLEGSLLQGSMLYSSIKNVMKLEKVQRQSDRDTLDFLLALRDGKVNIDQWTWFNEKCKETAIRARGNFDRFEVNSDCVHIYTTNAEVHQHNHRKLRSLNKAVNKLSAKHDSSASKTRPSDTCDHLPAVLYLSIGSSVMLLKNVLTVHGLVNGSCGTVKDFLYDGTEDNLPCYIIIEFPSYTGPPFFSRPEQRTWVPLRKHIYTWGDQMQHFRESFPISLAYALTAWKSQGMTITRPVWVSLGGKEKEHGCSYVSLSRVRNFSDLCIGPGVEYQRLQKIGEGKKLRERLVEDLRLDGLTRETKQRFEIV